MEKQLYDRFTKAIQNLNSTITLQEVAVNYVYRQIPEAELIQLLNRGLPTFNTKLLEHDVVFRATLEVLAVMESCNTWTEFEHIIGKQQSNKTELDKFNRLLKAFVKNERME